MIRVLIMSLLFISGNVLAQNGTALWSSIALEKKINKKFDAQLQFQTRWVEDISYIQTYFADLGLEYKFMNNWHIAANYRRIERRKNETKEFKSRNRYYFDLGNSLKISKLKIDQRLRYQRQFRDNDGDLELDADYLRYKVELSLAIAKKISPYISTDFFYLIGETIDQLRPKVGLNYKVNKHHGFDVNLFKDIGLGVEESSGMRVGLAYKYKF